MRAAGDVRAAMCACSTAPAALITAVLSTSCCPHAVHMLSTCCPHAVHMLSTWCCPHMAKQYVKWSVCANSHPPIRWNGQVWHHTVWPIRYGAIRAYRIHTCIHTCIRYGAIPAYRMVPYCTVWHRMSVAAARLSRNSALRALHILHELSSPQLQQLLH